MSEYAACDNCEHDGPHELIEDGKRLVCGECEQEFDNPFASDHEVTR